MGGFGGVLTIVLRGRDDVEAVGDGAAFNWASENTDSSLTPNQEGESVYTQTPITWGNHVTPYWD